LSDAGEAVACALTAAVAPPVRCTYYEHEPRPGDRDASCVDRPDLARLRSPHGAAIVVEASVEGRMATKAKKAKKKARRTTHRSSKGTKLYAVRDAKGRFKDIQTYKRAHGQDIKRKSKKEKAK
jgi:hypothetical protein